MAGFENPQMLTSGRLWMHGDNHGERLSFESSLLFILYPVPDRGRCKGEMRPPSRLRLEDCSLED